MLIKEKINVQEQDLALSGTFFLIYFKIESLKVFKKMLFLKMKCHIGKKDQKSAKKCHYLNSPPYRY